MVRVLQVLGGLNRGGAETVVVNWLNNVDRSEIQFDFLVYGDEKGDYEDEVQRLGSKVIHIPLPSSNYYQFYKDVKRVLIEEGPYDVVHVHTLFNSGFVLKAAYNSGTKIRICHSHSTHNREGKKTNPFVWFYEFCMRIWIIRYATDYLACGIEAGAFLYGKNFFARNGEVIYNGILAENFQFSAPQRELVRNRLAIPKESLVIGHIGRFTEVKNHDFLLDVFLEFIKESPDAKLLLVGQGPLQKHVEKRVSDANVMDQVIFTGLSDDVISYLQAMDIVVFPSLFEGLPMALLEAQANGLPCLASDSISQEIKILDTFTFISLSQGKDKWSLCIKNMDKQRTIDATQVIKCSKFNLQTSLNKLLLIYKRVTPK